ncbi:MAG: hypothetical protein IPH58_17905 [Sphingobacteriales bacterium]|nr:hypothetical protein [Sphingobacteriales bacterium]
MALRAMPPFFTGLIRARGLKGYEAKAKSPANFAEMKRTFRTKTGRRKQRTQRTITGGRTCADLWQHAIEVAEKKFNIDILKSMVPNNPLLPKAKTERKITEMCGVFGRSKQAYYKQCIIKPILL